MNYNAKIACENQAKVINFTIEDSCLSTNTITQVFNGVVKDNYTVSVGLGCKKHRGKAVPFIKAIAVAKQLRFYKSETIPEYEEHEFFELMFTIKVPLCNIEYDHVDWGTFFAITPDENTMLKVDVLKLGKLFESKGLDMHIAVNGRFYTHNKIKFVHISPYKWDVVRIGVHKSVSYVHKNVEL